MLQDAVSEGKTDFVRLLLEHGCGLANPFGLKLNNFYCRVDATVATDEKGETPNEIVWNTLFWTDEDSGMERNFTEIAGLLCEATGEFSDDMKLRRLWEAMYEEDKYDGMEHFSEILSSLSPEMVSFKLLDISVQLDSYNSSPPSPLKISIIIITGFGRSAAQL